MRALKFGSSQGPGKLIVVEGLDGSGKTTIVEAIRQRLTERGAEVRTSKLPSAEMRNTRMFEILHGAHRDDLVDPLAFELAYMADRLQQCTRVIEPELRAGNWVVSDRYLLSSIGLLLIQVPRLWLVTEEAVSSSVWFEELARCMPQPDLGLYLHASSQVTRSRIHQRAEERHLKFSDEEFNRLESLSASAARGIGFFDVDTAAKKPDACLESVLPRLEALFDGSN